MYEEGNLIKDRGIYFMGDSNPSGGGVFSVSRAQPEIKFLVQPESEHISTANFITYFPVSHQSL